MHDESKERGSFKGSLGFVLAAAGSAVGLGNIWRFPYLAAKNGGGVFLVVYIVLALTFGFALLTSEVAIGRNTKQSPLTAYGKLNKKWAWIGLFAYAVPFLIMPYYSVIGGWVIKYFVAFATGHGVEAAQDGYFGDFITGQYEPIIYMGIFLIACAVIIYMGVSGGIERSSKIIMPVLLILVVGISIYSLTLRHTSADGVTTTGLDGLKVYVVPDFEGMTITKFFGVFVDALTQLFFSLSIAMGIMIAYGSYVPDKSNLVKSINQIEFFDTFVAVLAGIMIIPAVYVFNGTEGMTAGPSLMFVALPKVFADMGSIGNVIGTLFFAMVLFAAITSGISIFEAIISSLIDRHEMSRPKATILETIFALLIGGFVCFGYNVLYVELKLPNTAPGGSAQILDVLDYISNNIMMPVVAIGTCLLVGWVLKPKFVKDEATKNGEKFGRSLLFDIMIKYVSPALLIILLLKSLNIL